ncbi:hypothetical protein BDV19DRAFT_365954 [Aspergillus venezuelensis]
MQFNPTRYMDDTRCYICGSDIYTSENPRTRGVPGTYMYPEIKADKRVWKRESWYRYLRMIFFDTQTDMHHLSGISCLSNGRHTETIQVPWDERTAIIPGAGVTLDERLVATVIPIERDYLALPLPRRLLGFTLHALCWDLLCAHKSWDRTISSPSLKRLNVGLRRKQAEDWDQRNWRQFLSFDKKVNMIRSSGIDPFNTTSAKTIIRLARHSAQRPKAWEPEKKTYFALLPAEILFLIADSLSANDIAILQESTGIYLSDKYWRSRVCHAIPEFKDLSSEPLDWQYICGQIERPNSHMQKALECRQWVIGRVGKIIDLAD